MRNRIIGSLSAILLVVISLTSTVWGAPNQQDAGVVRIGMLVQQGSAADLGAQLAIKNLNLLNERNPAQQPFRFELLYPRSYPNDPAEVPPTLSVLIDELGAHAILGPTDGNSALANLEPLARAGVPVLTLATIDSLTEFDVTNNIMRMRAAELYHSNAAADYMLNDLALTDIALVQTDIASTEALVAYELRMIQQGLNPVAKIQLEDASQLADNIPDLLAANPQAVAVWGQPADAINLLTELRRQGWNGVFFYRRAQEAVLRNLVPINLREGLLGVAAWSYGIQTPSSRQFLLNYVTEYGTIPTDEAASAYDAVLVLSGQVLALRSVAMPGLYQALREMPNVLAVQGDLAPVEFGNGDYSRSVVVYQMTPNGGVEILAQYRNDVRLQPDEQLASSDVNLIAAVGTPTFTPTATATATPEPTITPTPAQVQLTVLGTDLDVWAGPGDFYEVLGQLQAGAIATVIGGDSTLNWLVIQYRGGIGWVVNNSSLISVFDPGNLLNQLPILQPPPTPIGGVTPTPATELADIIIDTVFLEPTQPVPGQPFTAFVTVRNGGNTPTGPFTLATTFEPGAVYSSNVVANLEPNSTFVIPLSATVLGTGDFSTDIVADVNNEVEEGGEGEFNNFYRINYRVDYAIVNQVNGFPVFAGDGVDLAGGTLDLQWSGSSLDAINGAVVGIITGLTYDQVGFDNLSPGFINVFNIADTQVFPGVLIGVITAEGQRGVIRVEDRVGTTLTISFKVYG